MLDRASQVAVVWYGLIKPWWNVLKYFSQPFGYSATRVLCRFCLYVELALNQLVANINSILGWYVITNW
jgi:hypothetical protein